MEVNGSIDFMETIRVIPWLADGIVFDGLTTLVSTSLLADEEDWLLEAIGLVGVNVDD